MPACWVACEAVGFASSRPCNSASRSTKYRAIRAASLLELDSTSIPRRTVNTPPAVDITAGMGTSAGERLTVSPLLAGAAAATKPARPAAKPETTRELRREGMTCESTGR